MTLKREVTSGEPSLVGPSHQSDQNADLSAEVLFQSQANFLGVCVNEIRQAELKRGKDLHPSVSDAQIDATAEIYRNAQLEFLVEIEGRRLSSPTQIFCAPNGRTVDLVIDERAPGALVQGLIREGKLDALREAVEAGPGAGAVIWEKPQTEVELVASLLRWAAINGEEKKRIRVSDELRGWVSQSLAQAGITPRERLGGALAIATALSPVLGREATMMSLGDLPPQLLKHIPAGTKVVTEDPGCKVLNEIPRADGFIGNFCLGFKGKSLSIPAEFQSFSVNGKIVDPSRITQVEVFITGSSQRHGFGTVSAERLTEISKTHPICILSGMQYLTSRAEIADYFEHVEALHGESAQHGSVTALLYSEVKHPELEVTMWKEMQSRRCIDFLGMNSSEAHDILARLYADSLQENGLEISAELKARMARALSFGDSDGGIWQSGDEMPEWVFEAARCLQEALDVPLVRVRGKIVDALVADPGLNLEFPEKVRDSLIISRNMGTLKVANPSGILDKPNELEILKNVPHGYHLAGMQHLKDYLLSNGEGGAAKLDTECCFIDQSGRGVFIVPPIPFFSRRGETVSAGDTIDSTFVSEEGLRSIKAARELNLSERNRLKKAA